MGGAKRYPSTLSAGTRWVSLRSTHPTLRSTHPTRAYLGLNGVGFMDLFQRHHLWARSAFRDFPVLRHIERDARVILAIEVDNGVDQAGACRAK